MQPRTYRVRVSMRALFLAAMTLSLSPVYGQNAKAEFQQIKNLEDRIPLPAPTGHLLVGTFDAANGEFTGHTDTVVNSFDPGDKGGGKHVNHEDIPAIVTVNGVDVGLFFEVKHRQGPMTLTINGRTITKNQGNEIGTGVGMASQVDWSLSCNQRTSHGRLVINRPPVIGAGAFIVPVMPIAVLYEPPQDAGKRNSATYTQTRSMGTTVQMGVGQESSVKQDATSTFDTTVQIKDDMNAAGSAMAASGNPYVMAAGAAVKLIASGLGDSSATDTKGTKVTERHKLSLTSMEQNGYTTSAHEGPGRGDRILFLKNARLVWLCNGGKLSVALLWYDGTATMTVGFLKDNMDNGKTGLEADTIHSLLQLDPFVADGPEAKLTSPRYRKVDHYEPNGGHDYHAFSYQLAESDLKASARFSTHIQEDRKGWLSFLGIGIQDKTSTATLTQSHSTQVKVGEKVAVRVDLYSKPDELYAVEAYYDRVFGTFAFKNVPIDRETALSGTVQDRNGKAMANQEVSILVGDERYTTRTDAQGRYQFHAPELKQMSGPAKVQFGDSQMQIDLQGKPMQNLNLRP